MKNHKLKLTALLFVMGMFLILLPAFASGDTKGNNTPMELTIYITGNHEEIVFDGTEHSVTGYTISFTDPSIEEDQPEIPDQPQQVDVSELYDPNSIVFDADGDGNPDNMTAAIAKGTYEGHYDMNLEEGTFTNNKGQFKNTDESFDVTFIVTNVIGPMASVITK